MPASEPCAPSAARDRERLAAAVREAGAVALQVSSRRRSRAGPRAKRRRRSPKPTSPSNELLHERLLRARRRLAVGGKRGRSGAARRAPRLGGRSDRRHARLHRGPRGLDDLGGAGRGRAAGGGGALCAGRRDELFLAVAGGGATLQRCTRSSVSSAAASPARASPGPSACSSASPRTAPAIVPMPRIHSLALRLARVAQGELDAALAGGNGHDWDLAAADLLVHEAGGAMTALDGEDADLQSARAGARRPDRSRTRAARSADRSGARADQRAGGRPDARMFARCEGTSHV